MSQTLTQIDPQPETLAPSLQIATLADLLDRLGGISASRVRYFPALGTATEQNVLDIDAHEDRLCELIDGVLVEKPVGFEESVLAMYIGRMIGNFAATENLGYISGESGMMRLENKRVRIPDVAFISRERSPKGPPRGPIPQIAPDLCVEVLSESNTTREMDQKRVEFFDSGTVEFWIVDPATRTVDLYTSPESPTRFTVSDILHSAVALPGFSLDLAELFAQLPAAE